MSAVGDDDGLLLALLLGWILIHHVGLVEKMKYAVFVVDDVDVVVVVASSWMCLLCHPLWTNGPNQRRLKIGFLIERERI